MAKVSLRIYNREIETMVERGQLDEAIAHCRHILNAFPKHLDTYRLIGKAYLEAKRYGEATDIFERVLMAVPDDFVAHVGMSIIRDEQKDMDAAIWHMQRAFEVQPSNAAIQAELQRLYGRRDGIEPPKIRLTRGALAHMYVQGELYPQAISEIKGVLEEDRERQDMQVLMARAYFHAGQKGEAAEICSQLLRRYPYCFDANRVLVELLPQTERGESTQVYRHRISELDPYTTFVTGSVFHTEEVADAAVSLERLEWDGQSVALQPEWSDSLGIGLSDKTAAANEEPDWLKTDLTSSTYDAASPVSPFTQDDESAPFSGELPIPSADSEGEIPAFMREAGWGEDTGTFQEGLGAFDEADDSSEEPALAEGDLPDWIKAMAPTGAELPDTGSQSEPGDDLTQDDVPDWLQGLGDVQSTSSAEQPSENADVPGWLDSMQPAGDEVPEQQPVGEGMADDTMGEGDIPDWLKAVQAEEEAAPQEFPQEPAQEILQESMQESEEISAESLSDWQIGDEGTEGPVDFDKTDTGELGKSATEQDDAIAWLEGLASKHGAKPEELVTDPGDRTEVEPDWVLKAKATKEQADVDASVSQEQPPVEAPADLPEFLAEEQAELPEEPAGEAVAFDVGVLGTSAEEQDDAVAWLESLASKHGAKPEELVTDPEARKETAPDWVQKATQAGAAQPSPKETAPLVEPEESDQDMVEHARQVGESLYAELEESQTKEPISSAEADETGMWLQDLGEEGGFMEAQEPASEAETPVTESDVPAWLSEMEEEASRSEAVSPSGDEASLPDWLRDMDSGSTESGGTPPFLPEEESIPEPGLEPPVKIDINTAALEELADLPGIGDMLAQNIVAYREAYGGFSSIDDLSKIAGIGPSTIDGLREIVEFEAQPDIADWLQSVEPESSVTDAGKPSAKSAEGQAVDDLPSWLAGLDEDTKQPQPTTEKGEDLPEWLRAEVEEEPAQAEPTAPSDWQPAEPSPMVEEEAPASEPEAEMEEPPVREAPILEPEMKAEEPPVQAPPPPVSKPKPEPKPEAAPPEREPYREPVTRSRTGMTGMLSAVQDSALSQAQNELTRGNIPGAMENYGKLIKKGKLLDEIIFDLREAMYRYPVEVSILQTLGDAYMRANRLQDALDSYTKAEELLR